jgi:hypothetical protein
MTQQHGKCGEGTQPPLSSHPMHRQPICTCVTPNWPAALSRCPPLAPGSCSPARWATLSSSRPRARRREAVPGPASPHVLARLCVHT